MLPLQTNQIGSMIGIDGKLLIYVCICKGESLLNSLENRFGKLKPHTSSALFFLQLSVWINLKRLASTKPRVKQIAVITSSSWRERGRKLSVSIRKERNASGTNWWRWKSYIRGGGGKEQGSARLVLFSPIMFGELKIRNLIEFLE